MDSLVQYGADINCLVSESKITPLMIASSAGHTELVTWLLSRSANPNIASPLNGSTALMFASKYGHPKCIAEIVRHKGNLNAKDVSSLQDRIYFDNRMMEILLSTTRLSLGRHAPQNSCFG